MAIHHVAHRVHRGLRRGQSACPGALSDQTRAVSLVSLVVLDRSAAKDALATFLAGKSLAANQIEFVDLVVDHLTAHGVVAPDRLYESPFTDLTPRGPEGLFDAAQIDELIGVLAAVRERAVAA